MCYWTIATNAQGSKFKDADLVGIPFRVTVGKKVTEGTVEVVHRSTREIHDASIAAIADYFEPLLQAGPLTFARFPAFENATMGTIKLILGFGAMAAVVLFGRNRLHSAVFR